MAFRSYSLTRLDAVAASLLLRLGLCVRMCLPFEPGLSEESDAAVGEQEWPGAPRVPVAAVDGSARWARQFPAGAGEVAVVDRPLLHSAKRISSSSELAICSTRWSGGPV